jgi:hypothetical protein
MYKKFYLAYSHYMKCGQKARLFQSDSIKTILKQNGLFFRARAAAPSMAPATAGVSLNVGNLAAGAGGGYTCIHSRNSANEMMMTPPAAAAAAAPNANHSDQRLYSPKMRYTYVS